MQKEKSQSDNKKNWQRQKFLLVKFASHTLWSHNPPTYACSWSGYLTYFYFTKGCF